MCFLNDGALYSETLDRRHVCGNALRMSAAWSFVAELCANEGKPADDFPDGAKGFAGDFPTFLGVPIRDREYTQRAN
jgi:hypothetical protein